MDLLKSLGASLVQAAETFVIRTGLKVAGVAIVTWLVAKGIDVHQAQNLVGYATGFVITAGGIWASRSASKTNAAKSVAAVAASFDHAQALTIQKAQEQGVAVQAASDQEKADAVAGAIQKADAATKQDRASVIASLQKGTF